MALNVKIEQLLEAGAHFGHLTRRWNPKMDKFIFTERNGIHIFDLRKTLILLENARNAAFNIASQGKKFLFVGTKPQAKEIIQNEALRCNSFYVTERWLGGMLTNFTTIRKSVKRLKTISSWETDGTFDKMTKKERLLLLREKERLLKVFGGIEEMTTLPGGIFIVDIKKEHIAVKEARILGIPSIAIVDTNCDPELVDYVIPANDDSAMTIQLIARAISDAVIEGTQVFRERTEAEVPVGTLTEIEEEPTGVPSVKTRIRRRRERRSQVGVGTGGITPKVESLEEESETQTEHTEE